MRNYKNLEIWNLGVELVEKTYSATRNFPPSEKFTLNAQMCRAAISVPSNIAEGCSNDSDKAFINYLRIALGSAFELETQVIIAKKLNYLEPKITADFEELLIKTQRKINTLIQALK